MTNVQTLVKVDAVTVVLEIPGSDLPVLRRQLREHYLSGGTLPQYLFALTERIGDKVRALGVDWGEPQKETVDD